MAEMLIDGQSTGATDRRRLPVLNPANGELIDEVPRASRSDVDAAITAAARAFSAWARSRASYRASLLSESARRVRTSADEIATLLAREQGKPLWQAKLETVRTADTFDYFAAQATTCRSAYVPLEDRAKMAMTVKRPVGVVVAVTPWNFPLTLFATKLAPALAAGCTVVLKPASSTPLSTQAAIEAINSAGFPRGVINTVHGKGAEIGDALMTEPRIKKIAFTGQTATGKRIMELAAGNLSRITLELGGSDPMIVCDDADLRRASGAAAIGRFFNAGQACLAIKRIFVFEQVADEFCDLLCRRARSEWKLGDQFAADTKMGPLHTQEQREVVHAQVQDAVSRGARVLVGGTTPEGREFQKGWFYEPTVVVDVPDDCRMATEEVFGPAVPVFRVKDLDEAIAKANASPYGLGSTIFTRDMAKARRAVDELECGYTYVNDVQVLYDELPFGGVKDSGIGKECGSEALESYLETKSAVIAAN